MLCSGQGNPDTDDDATADERNTYMLPFQATQEKATQKYFISKLLKMIITHYQLYNRVLFNTLFYAYFETLILCTVQLVNIRNMYLKHSHCGPIHFDT